MLPYFFLTVLSSPHSLLTTPAFLIRACCLLSCLGPSSFPVAQTVKHLPIMQEIQVQSLGWEDFLEKEMAPHSSIFAWKIPWMEESGRLQSMGLQRVGHDWATSLSLFFQGLWACSLPLGHHPHPPLACAPQITLLLLDCTEQNFQKQESLFTHPISLTVSVTHSLPCSNRGTQEADLVGQDWEILAIPPWWLRR